MTGTPPVRRRLLGAALRRYRENLGYGLDEAAHILECDRSKISRIETGQRGIRAKELRELLTEYGVPDNEQAALTAIAHRGRQHGWWQAYRDVLSDDGQDYIVMEAAAAQVLAYEAHQVPSLLQTPDYARAVAEADPGYVTDEQRAHAVEVTLTRQQTILGEHTPHAEIVLAEGALHQAVGGQSVMRPQLTRLADLASACVPGSGAPGAGVPGSGVGITLQVLPFAAGAYPAAACGSMVILRFADTPSLGVVHLGGLSGGVCIENVQDVTRYIRAFAQLRATALPPAASARLLRDMARD